MVKYDFLFCHCSEADCPNRDNAQGKVSNILLAGRLGLSWHDHVFPKFIIQILASGKFQIKAKKKKKRMALQEFMAVSCQY